MRRRPQSLYFSKHGTDLLVRTRVTHAWRHHGLYSTLFTPACLLLRLLWEGRALTCPRLPSCSLNTPRGPQRCPRTLHHMQRSRYSPPHTRNAHLASHTHAHAHARADTHARTRLRKQGGRGGRGGLGRAATRRLENRLKLARDLLASLLGSHNPQIVATPLRNHLFGLQAVKN